MFVYTKNANVLILIISPLRISPKRTSRRWNQLTILLPTICWPGWNTPNEYEIKMLVVFHILAVQSQQFWHCLKLQLLSLWNSMTLQPFAVSTRSAKVTTLIGVFHLPNATVAINISPLCLFLVCLYTISVLSILSSFLPSFLIFFTQWRVNLHQFSPSLNGWQKRKNRTFINVTFKLDNYCKLKIGSHCVLVCA